MSGVLEGFVTMFTSPTILLYMLAGTCFGIIFGAIPGLSTNMALVVVMPLTFKMGATEAMALLTCVYTGGMSGGLISAILLGIPGTPAAIATTWDGYPMAKSGKAGKALGLGIFTSFIGGMFSFVILVFFSKVLANWAIHFASWEYFTVTAFALVLIGVMVKGNVVKGLIGIFFGLFLSTIGNAPVDYSTRFTFGITALQNGISMTPFVIGIYAVAEVIKSAESKYDPNPEKIPHIKSEGLFGFKMSEYIKHWKTVLMGALLGTGIGILPGLGGNAASIMSYTIAKSTSKEKDEFGKGAVDGLLSCETANNASLGGSLIPTLALGIPGASATAIFISALAVHDISCGPMMFIRNGDIINIFYAIMIVASVICLIIERAGLNVFTKVLQVPKPILLPLIMVLCMVGTYASQHRIVDVYCIAIFGLFGLLLVKLKMPTSTIMMGYILGPTLELYLRRGLQESQGSLMPILTRPVSRFFAIATVVLAIFIVFGEPIKKAVKKKFAK